MLRQTAIIASSSSGLTMSEIQSGMSRKASGALCYRASVQSAAPDPTGGGRRRYENVRRNRSRAMMADFYTAALVSGQSNPAAQGSTWACRQQAPGGALSRREIVYLIAEGVVSVADAGCRRLVGTGSSVGRHGTDLAVPHLGGGREGSDAGSIHRTMTAWWKVLGNPQITAEVLGRLSPGSARKPARSWTPWRRGYRRSPSRSVEAAAKSSRRMPQFKGQ